MKYFLSRKLLKWPKAHTPKKALKMKSNDRYSSQINRISSEMLEAYEKSIGVNLRDENRKFVRSEQTIATIKTSAMILLALSLLALSPLAFSVHLTRMIKGAFNEIVIAVIFTGIFDLFSLAYLRKISYHAVKERDASESILEKFERAVKSLDFRGLEKPLYQETVRQNLIAIAKDVADAEGIQDYLRRAGKLDKVNEIYSVEKRVQEQKHKLVNALSAQTLFGFDYTRRELFLEEKS